MLTNVWTIPSLIFLGKLCNIMAKLAFGIFVVLDNVTHLTSAVLPWCWDCSRTGFGHTDNCTVKEKWRPLLALLFQRTLAEVGADLTPYGPLHGHLSLRVKARVGVSRYACSCESPECGRRHLTNRLVLYARMPAGVSSLSVDFAVRNSILSL